MDLTHRFTVPTSVEEAWAHFNDVAAVAECFPGASVSSVTEEEFRGSVKVRLGPIAMVYNGSGTFVEKDEVRHSFVVVAKGKDKRGNGTAGATVTLTMLDVGGATEVEVVTDLAITGKPAQFGRGVMQDVSDKLLGQFVACLEQRLGGGSAEAAADLSSGTSEPAGPEAPPAPTDAPTAAPPTSSPPPAPEPQPAGPAHRAPDDALALGATIVPALVRRYGVPLGGAVLLLLLLRWVVGRRAQRSCCTR